MIGRSARFRWMDALESDACKIKLPNKYIDHTSPVIFGHVVVQMLRE